ncbi:MAG: hypothetical protein LC732_07760, partial [Acidobacteria bacterium]|nr:hypothetical protein [Acidobacteriota bacterium]
VSEGGLATLDLSATPVTLRHGSTNGCTGDYSVVIDGSYAFVGNRCGDGRIEVWDFSEPAAARYLREQGTSPISATYHDLELIGTDYLAGISPDSGGTADLVIVDRRDINNLKYVTRVDIPGFAPRRGRVDRDRLYLTDQNGQLATVDVSNPRAPVILSLIRTVGSVRAAQPHGGILAVADGSAGLAMYDTSPALPVLLGTNFSASPAWDVELRGTGAIVATGGGLATLVGLPLPPRIDVNRIEVQSAGGSARVIGLSQSIDGQAPLSVTAKNVRSAAELTQAVAADGSIDVLLAGEAGDEMVVT